MFCVHATTRLDRDPGFKEGRQYGRGKSGGQVRDEYRMDFDLGRGGFGRVIQEAGSVDVGSAQNAFGGDRFSGGGRERGGRDWERREGGRERSRERSRERGRDGERELPVRGEHEIDGVYHSPITLRPFPDHTMSTLGGICVCYIYATAF